VLDDVAKDALLKATLHNIKMHTMHQLDPCLSDQGCHLRSYALFKICEHLHSANTLTDSENAFLVSMTLITRESITLYADNGIALLSEGYNSPQFKHASASKKKIQGFLYTHKQRLSQYALDCIVTGLQNLPENKLLKYELLNSTQIDNRVVGKKKEPLNVFPFFSAMLSIFEIEETNDQFMICVNVKFYDTYIDTKKQIFLKLSSIKPYMFQQFNLIDMHGDVSRNTVHTSPALCFDMYSINGRTEIVSQAITQFGVKDLLLTTTVTLDCVCVYVFLSTFLLMINQYLNLRLQKRQMTRFTPELTATLKQQVELLIKATLEVRLHFMVDWLGDPDTDEEADMRKSGATTTGGAIMEDLDSLDIISDNIEEWVNGNMMLTPKNKAELYAEIDDMFLWIKLLKKHAFFHEDPPPYNTNTIGGCVNLGFAAMKIHLYLLYMFVSNC
jgi:hypothetical protein